MTPYLNSNAIRFSENLNRYANMTGKTISEALAREGPDFAQELYKQFRTIHPKPENIRAAAKSRMFQVRRLEGNELVPVEDGLSAHAVARAKQLLGGQKSGLFRDGTAGTLVGVRFATRGRHQILHGRKAGRLNPSVGWREEQLPGEPPPEELKSFGVKRLNLRALAVYLELLYRGRGAQGGTMAVQWLYKTWRRGNSKMRSQLVARSAEAHHLPIGTVDFEFAGDDLQTIVFKGLIPGTDTQAERRGILDKVYSVRADRLLIAVKMHMDKVARDSGL